MPRTQVPEEGQRVKNINELKDLKPRPEAVIRTEGAASRNDGLSNLYWWDPNGVATNANGTTIISSNVSGYTSGDPDEGVWRRMFKPSSEIESQIEKSAGNQGAVQYSDGSGGFLGNANYLYVDDSNATVGIGTSSPNTSVALEIAGTTEILNNGIQGDGGNLSLVEPFLNAFGGGRYGFNSNGDPIIKDASNDTRYVANDNGATVLTNGNVQVVDSLAVGKNSSPGFTLDVNGDANISSNLDVGGDTTISGALNVQDFTFDQSSGDLVLSDNNGVELIRQPKAGATQFVQGAEIGSIEAPEDSLTQVINASSTSAASSGDVVGYTFAVDNQSVLEVKADADGSGGITNKRVNFSSGVDFGGAGDGLVSNNGNLDVRLPISDGATFVTNAYEFVFGTDINVRDDGGNQVTVEHANTGAADSSNTLPTVIRSVSTDGRGHVTSLSTGTLNDGTDINISGNTINHANTGSDQSTGNSGGTFIQNVSTDGRGHVDNVSSNTFSAGDGLNLSGTTFDARIAVQEGGTGVGSGAYLFNFGNQLNVNDDGSNQVSVSVNDGSGSGLDADTVDGLEGESLMWGNPNNSIGSSNDFDNFFASDLNSDPNIQTYGSGSGNATNFPSGAYSYGALITEDAYRSGVQWYVPHQSSNQGAGQSLWYRSYWKGDSNGPEQWSKIWTEADMGSGSGLDADTLDGTELSDIYWTIEEGDGEQANVFYDEKLEIYGGGGLNTEITSSGTEVRLRVSHNNTSSQGNVSTGGATVIDDINVDGYGHVTNMNTQNRRLSDWLAPTSALNISDEALQNVGSINIDDFTFDQNSGDLVLSDNNGVELIRQPKAGPTQFIQGAEIGSIEAPTDSFTQVINAPSTSAAASGDLVGYTFAVDNQSVLEVKADADGSGGVTNKRVSFANGVEVGGIAGDGLVSNGGNLNVRLPINDGATFVTNAYEFVFGSNLNVRDNGSNQVTVEAKASGSTGAVQYAGSSGFFTANDGYLYVDDSSGNIGVGTNSPDTVFHVEGVKSQSNSFQIDHPAARDADGVNDGLSVSGTEIQSINFRYSGASPNATMSKITVKNYNSDGTGWYGIESRYDAGLSFFTTASNSLQERLTIDYLGNVGIGTSSPQTKLDVRGDVSFGSTGEQKLRQVSGVNAGQDLHIINEQGSNWQRLRLVDSGGNNGVFTFDFTTNGGSSWNESARIQENGNVGIGTNSPSYKLDVTGTIHGPRLNLENQESASSDGDVIRDNSVGFIGKWGGNTQAVFWDSNNVSTGSNLTVNGGLGQESQPNISIVNNPQFDGSQIGFGNDPDVINYEDSNNASGPYWNNQDKLEIRGDGSVSGIELEAGYMHATQAAHVSGPIKVDDEVNFSGNFNVEYNSNSESLDFIYTG